MNIIEMIKKLSFFKKKDSIIIELPKEEIVEVIKETPQELKSHSDSHKGTGGDFNRLSPIVRLSRQN